MAWFKFLQSEGYFNPENNPNPVQVKEGFHIPYWEILSYLEKLSSEIKDGKEIELAEELIKIIKNVSEHPKDNYRTWYSFIKILSNIPNEKVPVEVIKFIPIWLSGRFDTMLQTSELCQNFLPKFLNDKPSKSDIEKAELILHYLFQIEKSEKSDVTAKKEHNGYHSRLHLHFLSKEFAKHELLAKIICFCQTDFILKLGRNLKLLLLNYPDGINSVIRYEDKEFVIKIMIDDENLLISSKLKDTENLSPPIALHRWEYKEEHDLKQDLVAILKAQNVVHATNNIEDTFQQLKFALTTDISSAYGMNSIRGLDDRYTRDDNILTVFGVIFRDLLNEKTDQQPEEAIALLKIFCKNKKYNLSFYKRIVLYVICENWNRTKSLFWELIGESDMLRLFSDYSYQKEVYDLLEKNQHYFSENEKVMLHKIILQGAQTAEHRSEEQKQYWQLRWYSALKNTEPFREEYLRLSHLMGLTSDHYEQLGKVQWKKGAISPLTTQELLTKSNSDIAKYLISFDPKDPWEGPSISGLAETLSAVVQDEPDKFADDMVPFENLPYIYVYHIIIGLDEGWGKSKTFNWEKVLQYCIATVNNGKFYSGELKLVGDRWRADVDWVVGAIAHLLTQGMRDDKNAFDPSLLPLAKNILEVIVSNLQPVEDFKGDSIDYQTYSFNSVAGKSLRALLDYSLYRARTYFKDTESEKWETEIKSLFELTLEKSILDSHILLGMYFEQFHYLESTWLIEQVKQQYTIGDREWLAFINGLAFTNPPFPKNLYDVFYPHYQRAIKNHVAIKTRYHSGLVRHITAFIFWKFETLSSKKLLFQFLEESKAAEVGNLIRFISIQKDFQKSLSEVEQKEFQHMILELWQFINDKYANSQIEEEQKNLADLSRWIIFAPELDNTYGRLLLSSCKHVHKNHTTSNLLENFVEMTRKGESTVHAKVLGEILIQMEFGYFIGEDEKNLIRLLIEFLFQNGQKTYASEFCNKMAAYYQHLFLRDIYEANITN